MSVWKKIIMQNKIAFLLTAVYVISLIPIFAGSFYAYPQSDDWTYSWRAHLAWEDTHSLIEVGKAVVETVKDSYINWQGTFSSIALMALQPAVFGERFYAVTPFLMIGMLTAATMLFFRELFRGVKGTEWLSVSMLVLLVTVQRMVCKPVAFYWYNGAVHYIFMYCVGLMLVACMMKMVRKPGIGILVCTCILAIILGGGNLVTALSGAIGFVTVQVCLLMTGRKHKAGLLLVPMLCNFAAFAVNIIAPGNWVRQDAVGAQENPLMSVLRSFYYGLEFPALRWMDWVVLLMLLFLIPVAWNAAGKTEFVFPMPLLVLVYSYCFISAMFTPLDFAAHSVDIGRAQNAIFSAHILVLALNVIYFTGWFRKHLKISFEENGAGNRLPFKRIYYAVLAAGGIWCILLTAVPSPEYFTSFLALHDILDGSAQEYADTARKNIEILKSDADEVDIYGIPKNSELLTSDDIDQWQFGTKFFYRKDKVNVLPRQETE